MEAVSCKQFSNKFLRQALFYRFELRIIPSTVCRPFLRRALTNPFALVVHISPQFFCKILHVPSGSEMAWVTVRRGDLKSAHGLKFSCRGRPLCRPAFFTSRRRSFKRHYHRGGCYSANTIQIRKRSDKEAKYGSRKHYNRQYPHVFPEPCIGMLLFMPY